MQPTDRPTSVPAKVCLLSWKRRGVGGGERIGAIVQKGGGEPEKNKIKKVFRFSDRVTRREAREAHTIQKGGGGGARCRKEIEDPSFLLSSLSPHGTRGRDTVS